VALNRAGGKQSPGQVSGAVPAQAGGSGEIRDRADDPAAATETLARQGMIDGYNRSFFWVAMDTLWRITKFKLAAQAKLKNGSR
jgi:hypothetical protein